MPVKHFHIYAYLAIKRNILGRNVRALEKYNSVFDNIYQYVVYIVLQLLKSVTYLRIKQVFYLYEPLFCYLLITDSISNIANGN